LMAALAETNRNKLPGAPSLRVLCVQSHDILYTLSRDILYTPARAQHARGWQEGWHGRRWMFTSNASGL
jgi:hypothetical protein